MMKLQEVGQSNLTEVLATVKPKCVAAAARIWPTNIHGDEMPDESVGCGWPLDCHLRPESGQLRNLPSLDIQTADVVL